MTVFLIFVAFILGTWFGISSSKEEDCPQAVLGYDCQGFRCDHSKSELYRCKMVMAQHQERYEARRRELDNE